MKFYYLIIILVLSHSIIAQVGINTKNPQGVFHIDAKSDGLSNIADDIIINQNGNIGLGVLSPSAKIDISDPAATNKLRIEDGSQGPGKVLISENTNGEGFWGMIKGSGGVIYNITRPTSYPLTNEMLIAMPVTASGNYLISIRWWGKQNSSAYFFLYEGTTSNSLDATNIQRDAVEYYTTAYNVFNCLTINMYAPQASKGNFLKIHIASASGWVIGSADLNKVEWNPSVILFRI